MPTIGIVNSRRPRGFTYIGLMILVAILNVIAVATLTFGAVARRRAAEEALLYVGGQFRLALKSYYDATPIGQNPYPPSLDALLRDPRYPTVVRHLRRICIDPITNRNDWVYQVAPGGGITGVHSPSRLRPIKIAHFSGPDKDFTGKSHYSEWIFSYSPPPRASGPGAAH